ncbi:CLC4E protein, partial [Heliornis fulica]|nr:CLC4E protein [Heliornis fulica]
MASEITYAELNFKNASPAPVVEVPPETKKHEHHPHKYPLWLPWLISLLLFLVCIALLVVVLLVFPCSHSSNQPTALQQKFTAWDCISEAQQGKGQGWTCCPQNWKRFQKSCYYISENMVNWNVSVQNCTGMGSHLVVINSREEQEFLTQVLFQSSSNKNYYIGLRAQEVGKWHWMDQTPLTEEAAFWRLGEPSNVGAEKCVVIHSASNINNWNDVRCEKHYRVCEAAAVTV